MKKSIDSFLSRIQENENGTLSGGFASIKGGQQILMGDNSSDKCTTNDVCDGTNSNICVNTKNCKDTTNNGISCTNKKTCYF